MTTFIGFLLLSYLVGAIPFAWLIARARGIDIRTVGSGNVGATNVFRAVGKSWGVLTFTADVLKGFLPAFLLPLLWPVDVAPDLAGLLYGCAAIAGHNWPIYLGFKGGKGVATSAGVLLGVAPLSVGIGLIVWLIVFVSTRYVSLASVGAALAIPGSGWWLYGHETPALAIVLTVLGLVVVWRHRSNLARIRAGTEHTFKKEDEISS